MATKQAPKKAPKRVAKKAAKEEATKTERGGAKKGSTKTSSREVGAKRATAVSPRRGSGARRAPSTSARVSRGASPQVDREPRLRVRMYRHGLGDCLLLRFARGADAGTFNVLIDCGLISVSSGPKDKMLAVVADIAEACDNRIDIAVMTHEHWDHASGFSQQQAQAAFDEMDIREVWYAWTEDPSNGLGRRLRSEREAKVKAVSTAAKALASLDNNSLAVRRSEHLGKLLGFFGIDLAAAKEGSGSIGKTRAAFEYLSKRAGVRVRYRHPDDPPFALPGVEGVRVYTFGPPEDEVLLKKSRPSKSGREVYELLAESTVVANLDRAFSRLAAVGMDSGSAVDCPFDESHYGKSPSPELIQLQAETWNVDGEDWRQIELDWTQAAEGLAIDLDNHTNNSCLVLAFEFIDSGEVFLFPADAQVGNWLSWQDLRWEVPGHDGRNIVTAKDLLSRTVFYKVGHHGSHNATMRDLGLELMTDERLTAFIPVVKDEAVKNRWMEMPFDPLVRRLQEKTRGRLLRSDDRAPPSKRDLAQLVAQERACFESALVEADNKLYYELSFD